MRVLVVEDEHKIAKSLKQGLEQENYVVDVAHTGTEGLDLAASNEYDVIILDRLLPGMEGVHVLKEIRAKKIHTSVLFLTAKGLLEDRVEGLNAGADDYLTKPFAFTELLARVRALSRRPQTAFVSKLHIADLVLDTTTFDVKRAGKTINLSSKEFTLLEYLMRHANKTLTKTQIINNVWNYDADILPNTVEVSIKHLRSKLGKPDLIHTVRGFGYKISN